MTIRETLKSLATFGASDLSRRYESTPEQLDSDLQSAIEAMDSLLAQESYAASSLNLGGYDVGKPQWPSRNIRSLTSEGYEKLALIFRCVQIVSQNASVAPLRVYDEARRGEPIEAHPFRALMRRPNPLMGESVFWANVLMRAQIAGFCVIEKERDRAGNVIGLWPLRSEWLKAVLRRDSTHDWLYRIPGIQEPYRLESEDVIPFRYADTPSGSAYGIGPLELVIRDVSLLNSVADFLKLYIEHGMIPMHGLVLDTQPGQTPDQKKIDQMIAKFLERHGGLERSAAPMVLAGIKEIKRLGPNLDELAYTELRDLSELGIIQGFGVPASIAQIRAGLEHSDSRANAQVDEGKLYRQTISPLWSRLDDVFTLNLLSEFNVTPSQFLQFDTSDVEALQEDRNEKAAWINSAVSGGWLSAHAAHRELGLPIPAGPDYYLRSIAVEAIPVEDPLYLDAPQLEQPQADSAPQLSALFEREVLELIGFELLERTASSGPRERRAKAGATDRKLMKKVAQARAPHITKFLTDQADRIIPKVIRGLQDAEDIREQLAALAPGEVLSLKDVDWKAEEKKLQAELGRLHKLAGETSFRGMPANHGVSPGIKFDLANPQVRAVTDKLGKKVTRVSNETKSKISDVVTQGLKDGASADDIAASLRKLVTETYKNRAMTIARTETMHAYGEANALGFKLSGVVDRSQIFDNIDHDEDYGASDGLTCATRDGFVCELDEMMDHIYADHPNGSAVGTPILTGED